MDLSAHTTPADSRIVNENSVVADLEIRTKTVSLPIQNSAMKTVTANS
jgi:hypothetical protein